MAGQSSAMIGQSWTDVSVLGSQVFGQALLDSCEGFKEKRESVNQLINQWQR